MNNPSVANEIRDAIKEILPFSRVDIVDGCMECFTKGTSYDYAFISDNNEGMPWMDLMFHLAASSVGVYFLTDNIDKELIKNIKEASGLSAINSNNISQEIQSMFSGMADEDSSGSQSEAGDELEEREAAEPGASLASIQDYTLLKSRKYPAVIVSIHGAKGGVGKTAIAANAAVMLANYGYKAIAVDFDIENGNLLNVLHIVTDKDLKDVIKGNYHQTESSFENHPTGLAVLPSLKIPAESEMITAEVAERIIGRLARIFEVIIIDTGSLEIDPMLVAMQVSTKSYIVTTFDMTVVAKTYDLIENTNMMGVDIAKLKLVINRVPKKTSVSKSDISGYINIPILVQIPEDDEVLPSQNTGFTAVESRKCKNFSKGIMHIVDDIIKDTQLSQKETDKSKSKQSPEKRGAAI